MDKPIFSLVVERPPLKEKWRYLMNWKHIHIAVFIICTIGSYIAGLYTERTLSQKSIDEIVQIAQEACDMRIKTIKFTCKR